MSRLARVLLIGAALALGGGLLVVASSATLIGAAAYQKRQCMAKGPEAAVQTKAASLCSSQVVGCSLSHEQIAHVIRTQEAAKACQ